MRKKSRTEEQKKMRGLLCHNCNVGLGRAKDSSVILQSAIDYLKCPGTGLFVPYSAFSLLSRW